ncbi:MAG: ribulokinase [Candidatus Omnitrophica bacterium]|nr:ribulokinase [Candidatus Omnitrophota bacterium]
MSHFVLGLDFGTNSVRCLVVRVEDGEEVAASVATYEHGEEGILLDPNDPNLARQHPKDYETGTEKTVKEALSKAASFEGFSPDKIIGIGVDTTGSTPLPVDEQGVPLAYQNQFADNLNAMAWLWKDHTSFEEAAAITEKARREHPEYLAKCGGIYSSEWYFSKLWHCLVVAPEVMEATYAWVEMADWIPGFLTGNLKPENLKLSVCAAGHKGLYCEEWGGYPSAEFLAGIDPRIPELMSHIPNKAYAVDTPAGNLCEEWASKLGLPAGIPVAVGAFDAHLGAVGSHIQPGTLIKILGTSSCDMIVAPNTMALEDIPGICGIVDGSILPGYYGLEAGQSAAGDVFNWFVNEIVPGGKDLGSHQSLTQGAEALKPGESGLLALDWNNGNRCVLVDPRVTGLILGQTLHTKPAEVYRALIESTAFGARVILERFEEYGVKADEIINCGGIAEKNPLVMQIYADITGRPLKISRSSQTCALGAAICGAVVAGKKNGGYASFGEAQAAMTGLKEIVFEPIPENQKVYDRLYKLYRDLYDAFGTKTWEGNLHHVMKELLEIRDEARKG